MKRNRHGKTLTHIRQSIFKCIIIVTLLINTAATHYYTESTLFLVLYEMVVICIEYFSIDKMMLNK
jgi:general stress protein CsbA